MRSEGIEPSIQAWEAHVLPLYYDRSMRLMVPREGVEPSRREGTRF